MLIGSIEIFFMEYRNSELSWYLKEIVELFSVFLRQESHIANIQYRNYMYSHDV